jgi:hypothetical protein
VVEVDPGTYRLTAYFNEAFIYANDVEVVAGQVTTVTLGGILLTTIEGSEGAVFDIFSNEADELLQRPNDSDGIVAVPAGVYRVREYFDPEFIYVEDLAVAAGEVTTFPLGAFTLVAPDGSREATFDILSADAMTVLQRANDDNRVRAMPPGDFRIQDYFNELLPFADVTIVAGRLTTFEMGALLYNGAESSYDIYDSTGNNLRVRPASMGEARPLPPGEYVLKDYFTDDVIGAATITAGQITTVP